MKKYDFLVVGAGLFGAVFAYEAARQGRRVLVLERRSHLGGNIYSEAVDGVQVHRYGAHIFHTDDRRLWDYVNAIVPFRPYVNSPLANYGGKLYNLPFNMHTFYQLWGTVTPQEARERLQKECAPYASLEPQNLEEQALKLVGPTIYETLIKGYTEKQWGCDAKDLPAFIIKRLPLRFTYNNNYFNDRYQGIPEEGYTALVEKLLAQADVRLDVDYLADKARWDASAEHVLFTGRIDEYFNFSLGHLDYRSLRFETERMDDTADYQGTAVINFTEREVPYTRRIEHKHFMPVDTPFTIVTREYPEVFAEGKEPYYPVNNARNNALYQAYATLAAAEKHVSWGGRLAQYAYLDMDDTVCEALKLANRLFAW